VVVTLGVPEAVPSSDWGCLLQAVFDYSTDEVCSAGDLSS
jgi:hypothetical protein